MNNLKRFIANGLITILCWAACLTIAGCMPNKYVAKQQYLLQLSSDKTSATTSTAKKSWIIVAPTNADAPFDQLNFLYRIADNQYLIDYYHGFLLAPSEQLNSLLTSYLQSAGKPAVTQRDSTTTAGVRVIGSRLRVKILELYADYRERNRPQAVVALRFNLIRPIKTVGSSSDTTAVKRDGTSVGVKPSTLIVDKTIRVAIPLKTKSTDSLLLAWNQCLEKLFGQIEQATSVALSKGRFPNQVINRRDANE